MCGVLRSLLPPPSRGTLPGGNFWKASSSSWRLLFFLVLVLVLVSGVWGGKNVPSSSSPQKGLGISSVGPVHQIEQAAGLVHQGGRRLVSPPTYRTGGARCEADHFSHFYFFVISVSFSLSIWVTSRRLRSKVCLLCCVCGDCVCDCVCVRSIGVCECA